MCGICGYVSKNRITKEELSFMNDTMYHRGPNDSGVECYEYKDGYTIGFAQRRLSILDLSQLGHQPMHSRNGRISVVYNGECYNFLELKKELNEYDFQSDCDTEVIIAAYLKWGIDSVKKLKGMFAIAIYDRELEKVFLVRDRIGKKPLYYSYDDGNLIFASELKPIIKSPEFKRELNTNVIKGYLYQSYIQGRNTIFQNVYKLAPGSVLTFHRGSVAVEQYWSVSSAYHENRAKMITSYDEAKSELKKLLLQATRQRMIADVPLGTFLSGGYDSSLITAVAQSISSKPVKTFSIGFNDETHNEAQYAKEVSRYLGTNHTEHYISEKEMFAMIADIPKYYDEPFADSSQIPTMLVSKIAREKVTVALSGDGGDEFFCGYNLYDYVAKAQKLDRLGGLAYGITQLPLLKQADLLEKLPFSIRSIVKNRNVLTKTQFEGDNYIRLLNQLVINGGGNPRFEIENQYSESNWQIRRMLLDMNTYLPDDILVKVDRASMKYSLETRSPILDTDVCEYSFRIPHRFKYNKGIKKYILKDIAYDYIPKELLERPKVGFSVPLDTWLRGPLQEELRSLSEASFLTKQGIFEGYFMNKFITDYLDTGDQGRGTGENYSSMVWAFYVFQSWYNTYMKEN